MVAFVFLVVLLFAIPSANSSTVLKMGQSSNPITLSAKGCHTFQVYIEGGKDKMAIFTLNRLSGTGAPSYAAVGIPEMNHKDVGLVTFKNSPTDLQANTQTTNWRSGVCWDCQSQSRCVLPKACAYSPKISLCITKKISTSSKSTSIPILSSDAQTCELATGTYYVHIKGNAKKTTTFSLAVKQDDASLECQVAQNLWWIKLVAGLGAALVFAIVLCCLRYRWKRRTGKQCTYWSLLWPSFWCPCCFPTSASKDSPASTPPVTNQKVERSLETPPSLKVPQQQTQTRADSPGATLPAYVSGSGAVQAQAAATAANIKSQMMGIFQPKGTKATTTV